MIKAGDKWINEATGDEILWCEDLRAGDPLTTSCMKINGQHPKAGDRTPRWAHHQTEHGQVPLTTTPPPGVRLERTAIEPVNVVDLEERDRARSITIAKESFSREQLNDIADMLNRGTPKPSLSRRILYALFK